MTTGSIHRLCDEMKHITIYRENNIRSVWPVISTGILSIMNKGPEYIGWDLNNVLGELLHNDKKTFLYVVEEQGEYAGFIIARKIWEEFTNYPVFHIWLMVLITGTDAFAEVAKFIQEAAKINDCKLIRMWSCRPGWDRVIDKWGGEKWMTIYQKEI